MKYSNEMLKLTCNFEFEYSDDLKTAMMNNWLCNLSRQPGCWFPMDLLQEKNIKQLKKMSQRQNATFGGEFFQEIIVLNIRAFLQSMKSMTRIVHLTDRGESHIHTKKEATQRELMWHMEQHQVHKFCAGRTQGHVAQDDFAMGYRRMADSSQIADFINQTLCDAGAIHVEALDSAEQEHFDNSDTPVTPQMVIGGMLVLADEIPNDPPIDCPTTGSIFNNVLVGTEDEGNDSDNFDNMKTDESDDEDNFHNE